MDEGRPVDRADGRILLDAVVQAPEELDRLPVAGDDDLLRGDEVQPARRHVGAVIRLGLDADVEVAAVQRDATAPRPRSTSARRVRGCEAHPPGDRVGRRGVERSAHVDPEELPLVEPARERGRELQHAVRPVRVEQADRHVRSARSTGGDPGVARRVCGDAGGIEIRPPVHAWQRSSGPRSRGLVVGRCGRPPGARRRGSRPASGAPSRSASPPAGSQHGGRRHVGSDAPEARPGTGASRSTGRASDDALSWHVEPLPRRPLLRRNPDRPGATPSPRPSARSVAAALRRVGALQVGVSAALRLQCGRPSGEAACTPLRAACAT